MHHWTEMHKRQILQWKALTVSLALLTCSQLVVMRIARVISAISFLELDSCY